MKFIIFVFFLMQYVDMTSSACFGGIDNTPYLDWVMSNGDGYSATACYNATSSDTTQGFAVHWKVDEENVYIAVAARAIGWVGFGLAETGGMKGADMVLFESANPTQIRDAHVLDERFPIDDTCQDWVLRDSSIDGGFIIFEAYRKLNTKDTQDREIINDSNVLIPAQLVIAAWGDSPTVSFHGPENIAKGSIRWYGTGDELAFVHEKLAQQADNFFDLTVNHTLKPIETAYVNFCFTWNPDIVNQGVPNGTVTAIAAEVIPPAETRSFVHHLDIQGSTEAAETSETCLSSYDYAIFSWAVGVQPFILPDDVGYLFGPSEGDSLQSFRVTIHYDNPKLLDNITDMTTIRVYYSSKPRQYELGIMVMGDVLKKLRGVSIPAGLSQYEFTCSSECSVVALDEPINVFQEAFHMHGSGVSAATYHIRNNEIIRQANVDFFDFSQSGLQKIRQEPYTINPGDSFITKFWFDSENGTTFGKGSLQEMNEAFLLYYPAKRVLDFAPWVCTYAAPFSICNSTMETRTLTSVGELERTFGPTPPQCSIKATLPNGILITQTSAGPALLLLNPAIHFAFSLALLSYFA